VPPVNGGMEVNMETKHTEHNETNSVEEEVIIDAEGDETGFTCYSCCNPVPKADCCSVETDDGPQYFCEDCLEEYCFCQKT